MTTGRVIVYIVFPHLGTRTHNAHTHTLALQEANDFKNAVFNDTVNIVEVEESFDGET